MQRLEAKSINGRTYYYLSLWGWKNGKCRRLSQKYLGKPEDIARAVAGTGPSSGIRRGPGLGLASGSLAGGGPQPRWSSTSINYALSAPRA